MLKETFGIIRRNFRQIFLFELLYRLGWYVIFRFLMRTALQYALDRKGYSYLTAENFKAFMCSPWTILAFLLAALFFLVTILFEVSALFFCFEEGSAGHRLKLSEMIHYGAHGVKLLLMRNPILWIPCTICLLPWLCAYFLAAEALQIRFLDYLCQFLYHLFPKPAYLAAAGLLLLVAGFLFLETIPNAILRGEKLGRAARRSLCNRKKGNGRILLNILICQAAVMLLVAAFYFVGCLGAIVYVKTWEEKTLALGVLLKFCEWLKGAAGILAGSVAVVLNGTFLYVLASSSRSGEVPVQKLSRAGDWISRGTLVLFVGICLYFCWNTVTQRVVGTDELDTTTMVTAHRGAAFTAPENTMAAMENAVNKLADYVEVDVQETSDGVLVLLHDNNLKRTTGYNRKIWDVTFDELETLDAASYFYKEEYAGEKVPTLDEVLDYCQGRMIVNIEVKSNNHNKDIVEKVVAMVEEKDMTDQCVITSMNYKFLQKVKELNPDITTGYVMSMTYGDVDKMEAADFLSVKYTYINEEFVKKAHSCGKAVHAWTVNTSYYMRRMLSLNVDNIITDRPELFVRIQAEEAGQESFVDLLRYVLHR
jgi:glycerophosphoryl diester phosphodiesterase